MVAHSRRGFMGFAGAGIAGAFAASWPAASAAPAAEETGLVVFNAKVYTVDQRAPNAQAFLVKGGRFAAVGTTDEMKALAGKQARSFDARGMTVVPGFIDTHNHAPGNTLLYDVVVGNPYVVEFVTIDSIVDKLRAKAQQICRRDSGWKAISSTTPSSRTIER